MSDPVRRLPMEVAGEAPPESPVLIRGGASGYPVVDETVEEAPPIRRSTTLLPREADAGDLQIEDDVDPWITELDSCVATPVSGGLARNRVNADEATERDRQVVLAQLHNLMLALRSNARFSSRLRFVQATKEQEHVLTLNVKELRDRLFSPLAEFSEIPEQALLKPFFAVIRSDETTEPISGVALAAFIAFLDLRCKFLSRQGLLEMANVARNSRSEITDLQSHEAVLARILQVYVGVVKHPAADDVPEYEVMTMMSSAYTISTHGNPSELLRRTAEQAMTDIVSMTYERQLQHHRAQQRQDSEATTNTSVVEETKVPSFVQHLTQQPSCYEGLFGAICAMVLCSEKEFDLFGPFHMSQYEAASDAAYASGTNVGLLNSPMPVPNPNPTDSPQVTTPTSPTSNSSFTSVSRQSAGGTSAGGTKKPRARIPTAAIQLQGLCLAHTVLFSLKDALQEAEWCAPLLQRVRNDLCRALLSIACRGDNVVVLSQMLRTMHLVFSFAGGKVIPQLLNFIQNVHLKPMITMANVSTQAATAGSPAASPLGHGGSYADDFESRERHEMQTESLLELCSDQAFPSFIYYHYDLSTQAPNVFDTLCKYLARNCYHPNRADLVAAGGSPVPPGATGAGGAPGGAMLNTINVLALDCLLAMLSTVGARAKRFKALGAGGAEGAQFPHTSEDEASKLQKKNRLLKFAELLMQDPPKGAVKFLRNTPAGQATDCFGISSDCSGWDIGEFLFNNKAMLDKASLAAYLGTLGKESIKPKAADDPDGTLGLQWEADRRDDFKKFDTLRFQAVQLKGFLNCFNYKGKDLLRSLRETVYHMALPKESQQIDRVMEEFAGQWYSANKQEGLAINPFRCQDAAFILSFSLIMLHTDLHSGKMDKTMQKSAFIGMNRGIDKDGASLPDDYLSAFYDDVKRHPIVMADQVKSAHDDDAAWLMEVEQSLKTAQRHGANIRMRGSKETDMRSYDYGVFQILWRPCVAAFGTVLDACAGSIPLERVVVSVEGLRSKFKQQLPKDSAIFESGLRGFALCASTAHSLQCTVALDHVVISLLRLVPLNVREGYNQLLAIGRSAKSLLALDLLIRQVHQYANGIREAWGDIASLCHRLYLLGLLSDNAGSIQELSSRLNKPSIMHKKKPGESIVENLMARKHHTASTVPPLPPALVRNPGIAIPAKPQTANEKGWFSGLWGSTEATAEKQREKDEDDWAALSRVSSAAPDPKSLFYLFDHLADEPFEYLMKGLILHGSISHSGAGGSQAGGAGAAPFDAFIASHSVHVTIEVAVRNRHRLHLVEQPLQESLEKLLRTVFDGYTRACDQLTAGGAAGGNPGAANKKQLQDHWRVIATRVVDAMMRLIQSLSAESKNHSMMLRLLGMVTNSIPPTVLGAIVAPSLANCLADVTASPDFTCDSPDTWECLLNTTLTLAMCTTGAAHSRVHDRCLAVMVAVGLASSRCPISVFPLLSEGIARLLVLTSPNPRQVFQAQAGGASPSPSAPSGPNPQLIASQRGSGINTRPSTLVVSQQGGSPAGETSKPQDPAAQGGQWTNITQYDVSPAAMVESSQNLATTVGGKTPSQDPTLQQILASTPEAKVVEALTTMSSVLIDSLEKEKSTGTQQWLSAWLGTLRSLCALVFCTHCSGKVGSDALLGLQRCMLDRRLLALSSGSAVLLFSSIVFPLVEKVCSNSPAQSKGDLHQLAASTINVFMAPGQQLLSSVFGGGGKTGPGAAGPGMAAGAVSASLSEDMHCRCVSLLPKAYLHYFGKLVDDVEFLALWRRVMGVLFALYTDQRLHQQQGNKNQEESILKEAIQETVRNLVFVLSSMYQVPESKALFVRHPDFWKVTKELVTPFDFSGPLLGHLESMGL